MELPSNPPVPRWLRVWAAVTAVAALPLVTLGAEVTTKKVGMADPKGFRLPWGLFAGEGGLGLVIEHSHRLAGFVVGLCCIVLAVGLTLCARGKLYRSLGWLALLAVGLQGMLGIFRVDLNAILGSSLALLHGCFAQLVFATLVAVAVMTSRAWSCSARAGGGVGKAALGLCLLVYLQVVFGAIVRHKLDPAAQRLHILLAFAVLVVVFLLVVRLRANPGDRPSLRLGYLLVALVVLQPVLGVEAWMRRFGTGTLPELMASSPALDIVRSGHHVLGTLIFATTVALTVMLHRPATTTAVSATPLGPYREDAA